MKSPNTFLKSVVLPKFEWLSSIKDWYNDIVPYDEIFLYTSKIYHASKV